jgi:regulator of protease activity HflC (stomatin/prohibitin superfamily)
LYGLQRELLSLIGLSLQAAIAALSLYLSMDARSIRTTFTAHLEGDSSDESAQQEFIEARSTHLVFLAGPMSLIVFVALFNLWSRELPATAPLTVGEATTVAVICLAVGYASLVLYRSLGSLLPNYPELSALAFVFRESQAVSLLTAGAALAALVWRPADLWAGRVMLAWISLIGFELIGRVAARWFVKDGETGRFTSPIESRFRQAILRTANPVTELFNLLEARFGVSFRSSWAIRFVRKAIYPVAAFLLILLWALTTLVIVETDQMAVMENFGRRSKAPAPPGLRVKAPWPFGRVKRYNVKRGSTMPIGYTVKKGQDLGGSLLWTRGHSEEFDLVLGDGADIVIVNAIIYYKINENIAPFLDYVYRWKNPEHALESYAYRCVMEHTRSSTADRTLSANRAEFAQQLEASLQDYVARERLGIDVVSVALVSLHPPVKSAAEYLAVISARVDAQRAVIEAEGNARVNRQNAESERNTTVAEARIEASRRIAEAAVEALKFDAARLAYSTSPDAIVSRLWFESLEEGLRDKYLLVVDESLVTDSGELLFDLRPPLEHSLVSEGIPIERQ